MVLHSSTNEDSLAPEAIRLLGVVEQLVTELHMQQQGSWVVTLDSSLDRDLGIDSLGRVELLARIEREFDVAVAEQSLVAAETPRDLLRAVLSGGARMSAATMLTKVRREAATAGEIPFAAGTLVQVLEFHATAHPDRVHIRLYSDQDQGEIITYGDLWSRAQQVAVGLQAIGLQHGQSVLIMLATGRDYFYSFFGILVAGGVPVPVYPPGRPKQVEEHMHRHIAIAANSLATIIITFPEAKRFASLLQRQASHMHSAVTVAELFAAAQDTHGATLQRPELCPEDIAFIQYTSGSTGQPKGVVLTHANLLANIRAMGRIIQVSSTDVFVSWLPLYHDMGLIGAWLGSLHYACQLVIMSPLAFIARPLRWLQAIHRFGGSLSAAPNFAYELCLRRIEEGDLQGLELGSWRMAFNGAEAVSPSTVERFIARFAPYGFRAEALKPVYGLAESSVGLAFPLPEQPPLIDRVERKALMLSGRALPAAAADRDILRFVSCGRPLPGHQIRIVDNSGRELPDRYQGQLQFQGPSATSGYFRNQAKTAELFAGKWCNSGDLAYIADGNVFITGRLKDMVIRAGRNIYPEELEEAIGGLEGVRSGNVAVFGSIDQGSRTERLIILAETRKRDPAFQQSLRDEISRMVTDLIGSPPDEIVLAPPNTVLKTSSGKIRRAGCRELYEHGLIGKPARTVRIQMMRLKLAGAVAGLRRTAESARAGAYAAWCWLWFGVAAPLVWVLVAGMPAESWRWFCIRRAVRLLARLTGIPLAVQGLENLPLPTAPCIFVANHASYLDVLVLSAVLPCCIGYVAKKELRDRFSVRVFLERLGTVFVERFDIHQSIEDAGLLQHKAIGGRSLLFFAEGTFTRMPGLLPFRPGAFTTATKAGLPVVPVAIRGTRSILRSDSWFPRRGAVYVTIGRPIAPGECEAGNDRDEWSMAMELLGRVRAWILKHCGEPDLGYERPVLLDSRETHSAPLAG